MSHRNKLSIILIVSIFLLLFGHQLINLDYFKICIKNNSVPCEYFLSFNFGHPIVLGTIPLILVLVLLQFFRKEVFITWSKFASVFIPLAIIIITMTPVYCTAPLHLCFDKKLMTKFLGEVFVFVSISLIIIKSFLIKKGQNNQA